MSTKARPFDVTEMLETDEDIQGFLKEAAATGDANEFIHALNTAARAKGMTQVAKQAGVTRTSLYKPLADGGKPQFQTIFKVMKSLGMGISAQV